MSALRIVAVDPSTFWRARAADAWRTPRDLQALSGVGLLALDDDAAVAGLIAADVEHWIDAQLEGLLYWAFSREADHDVLLRRLTERLAIDGAGRGWAAIRAQLPAPGPARLVEAGHEWTLLGFKVAKQVDPHREPNAVVGLRVRTARPADRGFVLQCLTRAAAHGLSAAERARVSDAQLTRAVEAQYRPVLDGDGLVLIGELDGVRVAHATVLPCQPEAEAHLVDVYVVPGHQGRGIARHLAAAAETEAGRAGYRRLTGTVAGYGPRTASAIVTELGEQGWRVDGVFAARALTAAGGDPRRPRP